MDLSSDQADALNTISKWFSGAPQAFYCDDDDDTAECPGHPHTHGFAQEYPVMSLGGLAGTGKTTLMKSLDSVLGCHIAYGTPTHKAAAVLRSKLGSEKAAQVRSYHSMIYIPVPEVRCLNSGRLQQVMPDPCGRQETCEHDTVILPCGRGCAECRPKEELKFERRDYFAGYKDLVVVDEASMLTEEQVEDIRCFGLPLLLLGDPGQLSPVKAQMNPWMSNPHVVLTENHRQQAGSGIIDVAMKFRETGAVQPGSYGPDAHVLKMTDPRVPALLERFTPSKDRMIICGTNKLRSDLNKQYHGEGPPRERDRLILLQSVVAAPVFSDGEITTEVPLFNGMTGTVTEVQDLAEHWAVLLIELDADWRGRPGTVIQSRVELAQLGHPEKLGIKEHRPGTVRWDYAYVLTAHKAQGSEAAEVIVFNQPVSDGKRWSYTAVTRSREKLVVII